MKTLDLTKLYTECHDYIDIVVHNHDDWWGPNKGEGEGKGKHVQK